MKKTPLNMTQRKLIANLQGELDALRQHLGISQRGDILYRAEVSYANDEFIVVEADGLGGAVLRVAEGNYPVDYLTREEHEFATELDAVSAAESFH